MAVVPFKVASGIRMVRIDRRSGRVVYGTWPNEDDPKPAVIWEAFKPQSEPRRAAGRGGVAVAHALARPAIRNDSDFLRATGGIY